MPFPFLAALPAIAAVAGSAINAWSSSRQVKKTNEANMALAKYQYDMNSPANVMQRYKDAGLNPHLIYGQAGGSGASYQAPRVDYRKPPIDFPNMVAMYQDVKLKQEQINNVAAQTRSLEAKTANENLKSIILDSDGKFRVKSFDSRYKKLYHEGFKSEWEHYAASWKPDLINAQIKEIEQRISNQQLDAIYQKYKNQWASMGLREGDHVAMRLIIKLMENAGIPISTWLK